MNKKKYIDRIILVLVYGLFAISFLPFIHAVIFAVLFSFGLNPLMTKLKRKFHLSDLKAITILVVGLMTMLIIPLSIIFIRVATSLGKVDANKISELPIFEKVQNLFHLIIDKLNSISQTFGMDLSQIDVSSLTGNLGKGILAVGTTFIANIPWFIFQSIVFILMLYYFLLNQKRLKKNIIEQNFLRERQVQKLIQLLEDVCYTVLISTVIIAFIQASIVAFASFLVGYEFFIIFVIGFFMAFVPVIGTSPLSLSLVIYSLLSGQYGATVILLIGGTVAGTVDNVIKTYIFSSKKESAGPVISLLTIIGALSIFGVLGLFLGPIIPELTIQIGHIISDNDDEKLG